ncbi:MAG: DUF1045 domain-containing protein [Rhizobiaceae bacterium]
MRYAIYFTPPFGHPLTRLASAWLGRDAFTGEAVRRPVLPGAEADRIADATSAPSRYGFHATIKAPFVLAGEHSATHLLDFARDLATALPVTPVPPLKLARIDRFLALTPSAPAPEVDALAARIVTEFDRFRAPATPEDIARRNPDRLTARQSANLIEWGYPYVFDEFRFHMTLTGPVDGDAAPSIARTLEAYLAPALAAPLAIDALAVFVEPEPGAPFTVLSVHKFNAGAIRRSA